MGLAGAKKHTKIQHDPNNTTWANNTDRFGHKILAAQGWKPGDYLGAENASHAEHYTAANASHIKITLREDNLGLGAQIGRGNADTFGLSMFSGLLGRLNGKVETKTEAQQQAERDAVIKIQHEQKYGYMNFVSGGFLVGDKIEERKPLQAAATQAAATQGAATQGASVDTVKASTTTSGKRKRGDKDTASALVGGASAAEVQKGSASDSSSSASDSESEVEASPKPVKRSKKDKSEPKSTSGKTDKEEKRRAKEERRARKEERRKRRAERQERRALKEKKKGSKTTQTTVTIPVAAVASSQVPVNGNGSRHATRQRYIQQKRMASMDPKALKEIFMIQATT